jgi:cytosine/adenosine deaminase-related metal-dependent hydrolase
MDWSPWQWQVFSCLSGHLIYMFFIFSFPVHSLRAVPVSEARQLFQFAQKNGLPLHIHLEEQPTEVEDCRAAHQGKTPVELLLQHIIPQSHNQV